MSETNQIWNVKKLLDWSTNYFKSKAVSNPRLSSELLLASVLNLSRMQLYLNFESVLSKDKLAEFKEHVLKRINHMPVQYILNEAYFRNIKLYVDENVLIPRPETELAVDKALQLIFENHFLKEFKKAEEKKSLNEFIVFNENFLEINMHPLTILEIGTGSGAIAISLTYEIRDFLINEIKKFFYSLKIEDGQSNYWLDFTGRPESSFTDNDIDIYDFLKSKNVKLNLDYKVIAVEKSEKAFGIANRNAGSILGKMESAQLADSDNKLQDLVPDKKIYDRLELMKADIIPLDDNYFISNYKNKINMVISNPPYVRKQDYLNLPVEIKNYEPPEALIAGESGSEVYKMILDRLSCFVADNCIFIFEIDPLTVSNLRKILDKKFKIKDINIEKDYNQKERILYFRI